jgi:NAD(P)-dependent dehydrogenase (short-subunit alcohol dehydrogenase family)
MNDNKAFIVTGPTSGYGHLTALELAHHGTVVLVGRDPTKLEAVKKEIEAGGGKAVAVVCDVSDLPSVKRAAAEIVALKLPIAGLLNNAGIQQNGGATRSPQGFDSSYATNHLGPFVLTEALLPALPDGANVVFIVSAVEDPERKQAVMAGFRGSRYISAEASARGEWLEGGSKMTGFDAYATSKQSALATAMVFARETPRLRINAVEPGFSPATGLSRGANRALVFLAKYVFGPILPVFMKGATTPAKASKVIAAAVLNENGQTGVYINELGQPMKGSKQIEDPAFQQRVVAETRAFLAKVG